MNLQAVGGTTLTRTWRVPDHVSKLFATFNGCRLIHGNLGWNSATVGSLNLTVLLDQVTILLTQACGNATSVLKLPVNYTD
jgi:hypothetical protein